MIWDGARDQDERSPLWADIAGLVFCAADAVLIVFILWAIL